MTPQEIEDKIRGGFNNEFLTTQDARSELHARFSEQGIRLIEYRKELIKTVAIVSAGLIATPKFLNITPNADLYLIGLCLLIVTVIFSLLNSRENIDIDEAQTAFTRSKLLPILNERLKKIKEYLFKDSLSAADAEEYRKYRESNDYSDEMNKLVKENESKIQNIHVKAIDYPSSLIMLLFTSGTFFISMSILFPHVTFLAVVFSEIIIIFVTVTNFSNKIVDLYSRLVIFLKSKII